MRIHAKCINPTGVNLGRNIVYLIEPIRWNGLSYVSCSWEDSDMVNVWSTFSGKIRTRKDRFEPIPTTHKFEPMKEEKVITPVYSILDHNDPDSSVIGLSKEEIEEHIEQYDQTQDIEDGYVKVYKTEVLNGRLKTTNISDLITIKPQLP